MPPCFKALRTDNNNPRVFVISSPPVPAASSGHHICYEEARAFLPASLPWKQKNSLPGVPSGPFGQNIAIGRRTRHGRSGFSSTIFSCRENRPKHERGSGLIAEGSHPSLSQKTFPFRVRCKVPGSISGVVFREKFLPHPSEMGETSWSDQTIRPD